MQYTVHYFINPPAPLCLSTFRLPLELDWILPDFPKSNSCISLELTPDPWLDMADQWQNRSVSPLKKKSENYIATEGRRRKGQGNEQIRICYEISWKAPTKNNVEGRLGAGGWGLGAGAWGEDRKEPEITRMLGELTEAHFKEQDSVNLSQNQKSFHLSLK